MGSINSDYHHNTTCSEGTFTRTLSLKEGEEEGQAEREKGKILRPFVKGTAEPPTGVTPSLSSLNSVIITPKCLLGKGGSTIVGDISSKAGHDMWQ